jgi:hypothetical protein
MEKKIATDTPLYRHDAAYAREHGELPLYRESYQANIACKEAIEEAISENYGNNRLNSQAVFDAVSAEFSMERIQYVLANTVQYKDWDGRISRANREWAQTVPVVPNPDSWGGDRNCYFVVDRPHTGLTDLFITHFRKELEKAPREKKPSVLEKLQKPLPDAAPKPRQRESAGALIMADTRDISMHFWATQEEYDLIQKNMALSGSTNLSAFLRKMAIDGMVIKLDMPEIQEMLHLLRRANANINQIARHLHDTGRIYDTDLEEILGFQKETAARLNDILTKLSALK